MAIRRKTLQNDLRSALRVQFFKWNRQSAQYLQKYNTFQKNFGQFFESQVRLPCCCLTQWMAVVEWSLSYERNSV